MDSTPLLLEPAMIRSGGPGPLTEYRDDILYPISFDSAGVKAQMRVFFDAAEMQAKGTPPGELKRIIKDRFKTGYYKAPERAGISYMLSPVLRTYCKPGRKRPCRHPELPARHVLRPQCIQ